MALAKESQAREKRDEAWVSRQTWAPRTVRRWSTDERGGLLVVGALRKTSTAPTFRAWKGLRLIRFADPVDENSGNKTPTLISQTSPVSDWCSQHD